MQGGLLEEVREQWSSLEPELGQSLRQYFQESEQQAAFWEQTLRQAKLFESNLREEAKQILTLTATRPHPETAARAIRAVGTSYDNLEHQVLTPVQHDLQTVIARIRECGCFQDHSAYVLSMAFSPDGQTIISGSDDQTLRLWDLKGNPIGEPFQGHSDTVWSMAFSPDGQTIISGSDDQTLRLWDLKGNPIGEPFQDHSAYVLSVAFSPDGQTIVSGSDDQTLRLWHGHWRAWLALCCNRLRHNPIFKDSPDDIAREACEVCQRLVWDLE